MVPFQPFSLFHDGAEDYALMATTPASTNIRNAAKLTEEMKMFMPYSISTMLIKNLSFVLGLVTSS